MRSKRQSPIPPDEIAASSNLDLLYRHHRDVVLGYIRRAFGVGPPDPSDVVQAAFEKFAAIENREQIDNPRAFLIASARNYVLDQRRRSKVRNAYAAEIIALGPDTDDFDPERVLVAKEQWRLLERAVQSLDPRRRDVLIMHRIHGLSSAEIARRMGCSPTLVKGLLSQALVQCQRALKQGEVE